MTKKWSLTGKEEQGGTEELGFSSTTLNTGKSKGVHQVELHCGPLRVVVLPTRGMSILEVSYTDGSGRFRWDSPITEPVHPMWVPLSEPSGLGWLDGFNEMFVRCGLESNGAPQHSEQGQLEYAVHGRIANLPAVEVEVEIDKEAGTLKLSGAVEETRFHIRRTSLRSTITCRLSNLDEIAVTDQIKNCSNRPSDFQLLYHTNIGSPILEAGARFVAPYSMVCPRNAHAATGMDSWQDYLDAACDYQEQVYFLQLAADPDNRTKTLLHNAAKDKGFSLGYQVDQLPCFSLWKNTVGRNDGYVTGLEPGVNYPNRRKYEEQQNRVVPLAPGEVRQFDLTLGFHRSAETVSEALGEIATLSPESPVVYTEPVVEFCEP